MFNNPANTTFGGFNNTAQTGPFGSPATTAFGKPMTSTSFGTTAAPNVFGTNTQSSLFNPKPTTATTGGLFGATTAPAFGQPATTQSTFGGFNAAPTSTSFFGTQQNANTNLFGTSGTTTAFGQTAKPAGFGFGTTTGTALNWGAPQQQTVQQTTPFGQTGVTQGATSVFGSPGGANFLGTKPATTGTGAVKFSPLAGTDTMMKNGQSQTIQTRHHCIMCMKEYDGKSMEELRYEDYQVGLKGPQQQAQQTTGLFGTQPQGLGFGTTNQITSTNTTGFGQTMTTGFGTTNQTANTGGLFGNKPVAGFGTQAAATTTSAFSFNPATSTTNLFATNTQANKGFGTTTGTSLFGNTNTQQQQQQQQQGQNTFSNVNNQQTNLFGTPQQNQTIGLFNQQNKPGFNTTTNAGFSFSQTPAVNQTTSLFNPKPAATTSAFPSAFGQQTTTPAPAFGTTTSAFGNQQNTSLFNATSTFAKPAQSAFSFNSTPATGTSVLNTNTGLTGGSVFGQNKPLFSGTTGQFGATNTFGSTGFGATAGSNTTGLGTSLLGTALGGNQMQQNSVSNTASSSSVAVHQQVLALVSSPFGDSPLLKNLLPASGKAEQILKPSNPTKSMSNMNFKISTMNNSSPKIKARVVTPSQLSKKSLFDGIDDEDPSLLEAFQPRPNAKRLVLRPKSVASSPAIIGSGTGDETLNISRTNETLDNTTAAGGSNTPMSLIENETINKENLQQGNRLSGGDRRSSTSWLKSQFPRGPRITDEDFDGQKSPFNTSDIPEDALENTVTEFRQHSGNNNNQQQQQQQQASTKGQSTSASPSSGNVSLNSSINTGTTTTTADGGGGGGTGGTGGTGGNVADKSAEVSILLNDSSRELDDSIAPALNNDFTPNKANIILRRAGYFIDPPLDQIDEYVRGDSCIVPYFTIGRTGYGSVCFPDPIDIFGFNFDEIVHFRNKEVTIYPDDSKKPPIGQGLNRRAQVTLDCVWPHDKNTHEPIKDPQRLSAMNYEGKLRRVSAKYDTRFLDYRPETGSWVFKVEHFSKYGLNDSDDDDDDDDDDNDQQHESSVKKFKLIKVGKKTVKIPIDAKNGLQNDKVNVNGLNNDKTNMDVDKNSDNNRLYFSNNWLYSGNNSDDENIDDNISNQDNNYEKQTALSPTSIYARLTGADSHKIQLMKASFFDTNNDDSNDITTNNENLKPNNFNTYDKTNEMDYQTNHVSILRTNLSLNLDSSIDKLKKSKIDKKTLKSNILIEEKFKKPVSMMGKFFPPPIVKPTTVVLKYKCEVIPLNQTIGNNLNYQSIADIGIQMGRKFRACWGPGLTLLSLSSSEQSSVIPLNNTFSQIENYVSGRMMDDKTSTNIVQRIQILGGKGSDNDYRKIFKESIEGHLRIQLNHCEITQENNCPWIRVGGGESGLSALHQHCDLSQEIADKDRLLSYANDVWQLCVALWGNLPDIEINSNPENHVNVMIRREALSDWLKTVVENTIQNEVNDITSDDKMILSLLTANKLEEACQFARKIGDYTLALLISQLSGVSSVKELVKQSIALWQATDVVNDISLARLKIYMLIAGEQLITCNDETVNVCENIDWKRALAIHLWYLSSPVSSITDVIELYDNSFNVEADQIYAAAPLPDYKDDEFEPVVFGKIETYDLCYHLLKLYSTGNHSLEELLNPMTHTSDPLDYRLSWLLQQTIIGLGYSHLSEHVSSMTHINFSAQLEAANLWHWSIFVVLHLNDSKIRKKAVLDLLSRHVQIDDDECYAEREGFLIDELDIPSVWINEAKAVKACAMKRYGEAAWYYLQAEQWSIAHDIIIEHLAADAIINENYNYLKSLLTPIAPVERNSVISGWAYQGQLLWEYMEIAVEIEEFLKISDYSKIGYKLELLQPQLSSLCLKINQFPCPTAKLRLCQAEIAKRTLHLARSLLMLQDNDEHATASVLVQLIKQLPLPEDYAQQELRPIVSICANEILRGH